MRRNVFWSYVLAINLFHEKNLSIWFVQIPQQTSSNLCNEDRAVEADLFLWGALLSYTLAGNMRKRKEPTKQNTNDPATKLI